MGTVYRKAATKPLPTRAKLIVRKGQRLAEWLDAKKKRRTAPVTTGKDGTDRIVITARTYTAKYRDGAGVVQEVATGCRDEQAARSVLVDLERRAELVKGKVLSRRPTICPSNVPITNRIIRRDIRWVCDGTCQERPRKLARTRGRAKAKGREPSVQMPKNSSAIGSLRTHSGTHIARGAQTDEAITVAAQIRATTIVNPSNSFAMFAALRIERDALPSRGDFTWAVVPCSIGRSLWRWRSTPLAHSPRKSSG